MKMYGPFVLEAKIQFTNGEQNAEVTYALPSGEYATAENIAEALAISESQVQDQLGEGWRLCTKQEFFNIMMAELTGTDTKFALSGGKEWDRD